MTQNVIDRAFPDDSEAQASDLESEEEPLPEFVEEQLNKPKSGRLTSIKCEDGSTKFCNEGSVGCYDDSVALCGRKN